MGRTYAPALTVGLPRRGAHPNLATEQALREPFPSSAVRFIGTSYETDPRHR